jgi:hypothetical protein
MNNYYFANAQNIRAEQTDSPQTMHYVADHYYSAFLLSMYEFPGITSRRSK